MSHISETGASSGPGKWGNVVSTLVYDVQKSILSDRPFTSLSRPTCAFCGWETMRVPVEKPKEKP